jgi:tetratricopeptide (TPR) repeat protein
VLLEANNDGDRLAVAGAQTVLGRVELFEESFVEAAAALDEAIAVWRELGDAAGEADALRWRGQADHERGWLDSAEEFLTQALELYTSVGDRGGSAWAQQRLAWIAYSRGDALEAERRLDESIRLFEESNDRGGLGWALGLLGWIRLMQGHIDEADRIASTVLGELDPQSGDQWARGMMILLLATTRLWRGRAVEAVDLARDARSRFESINDQTGTLRSSAVLARALVAAGRVHEARLLLDHARVLVAHETTPDVRLLSMFVIAAAAVEIGDDELDVSESGLPVGAMEGIGRVQVGLAMLQRGHAAEAIDLLAAEYDEADEPGLEADAGSALALALAVGGRPERAAEVAAEFNADQGTYRDQVSLHYARGFAAAQLGDKAGAIGELEAAVALVDETQDSLAQAITRLARARLLLSLDDDEGQHALEDALERLALMDLPHTLWDDVFRAATTAARLAG